MTRGRLFFGLAVLFVALVWWVQNARTIAVDRCLDGGGRWSHDTETCEM
jgi:hypothetical protein